MNAALAEEDTAPWYHALHGTDDAVRDAHAAGADPRIGDDMGCTPLHAAAQEGHATTIRLSLAAGAGPDTADRHGNSPLLMVVAGPAHDQQVALIAMLLAAGADPDRKNRADLSSRAVAIKTAHGVDVPFESYPATA